MDELQFDAIARSLASPGTRRRVFGALAALPVVGGLFDILGADEAEAGGGRRKRRKKRHKRNKARRHKGKGKGKQRRKQPKCTSESVAETCAGQCGSVTNACGQVVDCGSCTCDPPCGSCQTCDAQARRCVPDPAQQGATCGACQTCDHRGECSSPCAGAGCCDGETCQPGTENDACGSGGLTCDPCTGQEQCRQNADDDYVCTCVPNCDGTTCGADGCGGDCTCTGALTACSATGQCECPAGSVPCGGFCVPESCGDGGVLSGCYCECDGGVVTCIPGAVCGVAPANCAPLPGWVFCAPLQGVRRNVPPCPAGQTLDPDTCLCR